MTKEKLIRIQSSRGYEVTDLGKIVIFKLEDYSAMWFFNSDGTLDESNPPQWNIDR